MGDVTGQGQGQAVEVALVLVNSGDRRWDAAPADVGIGAVQLAGWQVHQLEPPVSFAGQDSYLIRLNYELALEPEVTAPPWFEVGFALADLQTGEPVYVLDALPRTVAEHCGPAAYAVSGYLNFTPAQGSSAEAVALPSMSPFVDTFGIGSRTPVRWRYMAPGTADGNRGGVRPGSYVSWIIVLVPAGCTELDVQLLARYDLDPDAALGCLPGTHPGGFRLALTGPAAGRRVSRSAAPAIEQADNTGDPRAAEAAPAAGEQPGDPGNAGAAGRPPRVFVSYAHDDDRHVESVRAFAEFLAAQCGLDVHLDRWDLNHRRDWYVWAGEQVRQADYVIIVASPMCRQVGDSEMANKRHRGLQSEMGLLRELLHSDRATWTTKLLPVVLPGGSVADIPHFLQPQTADHYLVEDLTIAGAEDLIRVITRQTQYQRPALAALAVLPPRPPAWQPPGP